MNELLHRYSNFSVIRSWKYLTH